MLKQNYTINKLLGTGLVLHFSTEFDCCTQCGQQLKIEKVKTKTVHTITYGIFSARETIKHCPTCKLKYRSNQLPQIIKPGNSYSYDCIVEVGMLRYIHKRQIVEIEAGMAEKYQIGISQTQIRRMCYLFLNYLGRLHYSKSNQLCLSMKNKGGYILFVDSTCEGNSPHLLTCIDGVSGFVLYSQKIRSENADTLIESFKKVKQLYGAPLCAVHDMGPGIIKALDMVFLSLRHIICHFHLLRDLGKDLLQAQYRKIQKALSNEEIYAQIKYQVQGLEKLIGDKQSAEQLFLKIEDGAQKDPAQLLLGILYGLLLNLKSREKKADSYGFPFDCTKLEYYKLVKETHRKLVEIDKLKEFTTKLKTALRFYKIKDVLNSIVSNKHLSQDVQQLEKRIVYFDKLRDIMRIAIPGTKAGLNDEGKALTEKEYKGMEQELKGFVKQLERHKKKEKKGSDDYQKLDGVIKQLNKYWDKIFPSPIKVIYNSKSKLIYPSRTNNRSEQFYRKIKHLLRRCDR
ncbi:MAG TPA: hypothetical protein VFQ86_08290 [Arachidicoccus soli]|nr:hypothetical protein [Arachidicoccus soli]